MLQYKNHRFRFHRISFEIPDGYWLETTENDTGENSLHLISDDEIYCVQIRIDDCCKYSATDLETIMQLMDSTVIHPISAITVNNIPGHYAVYRVNDMQFYELRLDLWGTVNNSYAFCMIVYAQSSVMNMDAVKKIVQAVAPLLNEV